MKLLNMLWESDINAEMLYKANPKLLTQFQHAETESRCNEILVLFLPLLLSAAYFLSTSAVFIHNTNK